MGRRSKNFEHHRQGAHDDLNPVWQIANDEFLRRVLAQDTARQMGNPEWQKIGGLTPKHDATPTAPKPSEPTIMPRTWRPTSVPAQDTSAARTITRATSTLPADHTQRYSGLQFINFCTNQVADANLCQFHGRWKIDFDRLVADALHSPHINGKLTSHLFSTPFGNMLCERVQILAQQRYSPENNKNVYAAILETNTSPPSLNIRTKLALQQAAKHWISNNYTHQTTIPHDTSVLGEFGAAGIRHAYIAYCTSLAHPTELPDCSENPGKTNAFRTVLKKSLSQLNGIAHYNMDDPELAEKIKIKLASRAVAEARFHINREHSSSSCDYRALLHNKQALAPSVQKALDAFVDQSLEGFAKSGALQRIRNRNRTDRTKGASL